MASLNSPILFVPQIELSEILHEVIRQHTQSTILVSWREQNTNKNRTESSKFKYTKLTSLHVKKKWVELKIKMSVTNLSVPRVVNQRDLQ